MIEADILEAPFPFFGGKRRIRDFVWPRLGHDVNSYLEPFFGSGAMLLGRPGGAGKYETVNDAHSMIANFWRAVQRDPVGVAHYADYPVIEIDLHARHQYLVDSMKSLGQKLELDPDHYNVMIAGWWVWGKSAWIGDGWCQHPEGRARPDITVRNGVHALAKQIPELAGRRGVHKKMPNIHGDRGINAENSNGIYERMRQLSERLRHVRVCSGDFERILSSSSMGTNSSGVAQGIAPCGVYLDPPYRGYEDIYGVKQDNVHDRVLQFCKEYGEHPRVRIALSGYEGDYELPGWEVVAWKAHGGYANQNKDSDNENAHRERVWFSPSCLKPKPEFSMHDVFARHA